MEIRENDNLCIITPLCKRINEYECSRIIKEITGELRDVALDLSCVQDCTIDFLEKLQNLCIKKKVGIFNISPDLFVLFNIMNLDKLAKIFVSELDFEEDTRQIINRKFEIV